MSVKRRVMKFLIPLNLDSLGRVDLAGRAVIPMYISPQTVKISDNKLIEETLTKGGYVVHYWGEALTEINVSGTTGSGGIEAINILRAIYRNEIGVFNEILDQRALVADANTRTALEGVSVSSGDALTGVGEGIVSVLDQFTNGSISEIQNGIDSILEEVTTKVRNAVDDSRSSTELVPGIGSLATNMIIYFQGEKFLGFFKNFSVDENATKPGWFDYNFTFKVTKRIGERKNFMPWHRSPVDASGAPISVSTPRQGQRLEELSFPSESGIEQSQRTQESIQPGGINRTATTVTDTQDSTNDDVNRIPINRGRFIRGD